MNLLIVKRAVSIVFKLRSGKPKRTIPKSTINAAKRAAILVVFNSKQVKYAKGTIKEPKNAQKTLIVE